MIPLHVLGSLAVGLSNVDADDVAHVDADFATDVAADNVEK